MAHIVRIANKEDSSGKSVLVVVAHPDDETLGAGATMHYLARSGIAVHVCILSGEVTARNLRPDDQDLRQDTLQALTRLGVSSVEFGDFPNIRMNTVAHLEMVQFIERAIKRVSPQSVLTHHPMDINDDHRQVSSACQAAARLPQRNSLICPISDLLFMEVLSSTDWAYATDQFQPTLFQEVEAQDIDAKIEALEFYRDVMRPHPHPRSEGTIRALSVIRGAQAGAGAAEAFTTAFMVRRESSQW